MYIYLIENLINHKIYIGQTTKNIKTRWCQHKYNIKKINYFSYLNNAIIKYGVDNFKITQLDTAKTKIELDKLEKWWIEIFNSNNREIGYNIQNGGNGSGKMSDETKTMDLHNQLITKKEIIKCLQLEDLSNNLLN